MNIKKIVLLGLVCFVGYNGVLKSEETSSAETSPDNVSVKIRKEFSDEDIITTARNIEEERMIESFKGLRRSFTNADLLRLGQRQYEVCRGLSNMDFLVMPDVAVAAILAYSLIKGGFKDLNENSQTIKVVDNPLENFMKHQIWYKRDGSVKRNPWGDTAESIVFKAADSTINYVGHSLNQFESVKSKTDLLSEKSRHFFFKNGKMVTSAAFGRAGRVLVEEGKSGLNSKNLQEFGKDAFRNVTAELTNEYIAPTVANWIPIDKDLAKGIVNIGAFIAINSFLCKK